jgi:hypothetical protein
MARFSGFGAGNVFNGNNTREANRDHKQTRYASRSVPWKESPPLSFLMSGILSSINSSCKKGSIPLGTVTKNVCFTIVLNLVQMTMKRYSFMID